MNRIKQKLSKLISRYRLFSAIHIVHLSLLRRRQIGFVKHPSFQGWGMTTTTGTPWQDGGTYSISQGFIDADMKLRKLVENRQFALTQFTHMFPEKKANTSLDKLRWRHYVVYWSSGLRNADGRDRL